jgi:hypothetical protein
VSSNEEENTQDWDIVGVDDFVSYGLVLGCMVVPTCGIALLLSWLIVYFGAPAWATYALGLVYVTFPFAAFTWWTWNKKAIRLRDGRVLQARAARRFALTLWFMAAVVILYRFTTW